VIELHRCAIAEAPVATIARLLTSGVRRTSHVHEARCLACDQRFDLAWWPAAIVVWLNFEPLGLVCPSCLIPSARETFDEFCRALVSQRNGADARLDD
jgi:hypothetical protein